MGSFETVGWFLPESRNIQRSHLSSQTVQSPKTLLSVVRCPLSVAKPLTAGGGRLAFVSERPHEIHSRRIVFHSHFNKHPCPKDRNQPAGAREDHQSRDRVESSDGHRG